MVASGTMEFIPVVTVVHKDDTHILQCIHHLEKSIATNWVHFVVDNSEDSGSNFKSILEKINSISPHLRIKVIEDLSDLPKVILPENWKTVFLFKASKNAGFASANNLYLRYLLQIQNWTYVLLLNNDAFVGQDVFEHLNGEFQKRPHLGLLGCKLLNFPADGKIQALGGIYNFWFGTLRLVGAGNENRSREEKHLRINYPNGAAMAIKNECLQQSGLFDESLFLYFEEYYLSKQARKNNWEIDYCYNASVHHIGGASINNNQKILSEISDFYYSRNKFLIAKMFNPLALITLLPLFFIWVIKRIRLGHAERLRFIPFFITGLNRSYTTYKNGRTRKLL